MIAALLALLLVPVAEASQETWRGLVIAPEHRCAPYRRADYPYSGSVERKIVRRMGGRIYAPYTGRTFSDLRQTQIEHIVALAEAHDSGLCARDAAERRRFASDLGNLTLASPEVNRAKSAHDAARWMPMHNSCWFAGRVVDVRRRYALTIDRREAQALERILSACPSTAMVFAAAPDRPPARTQDPEALRLYDDNGNGRITCREARRHGIAPVPREHPAYAYMHDGDGDGTVCE